VVQADFQKGLNLGVKGTPTFFINCKTLVGLQPIGEFENAIEDARREAEGG
jgi:protein-disulfide isomerase